MVSAVTMALAGLDKFVEAVVGEPVVGIGEAVVGEPVVVEAIFS